MSRTFHDSQHTTHSSALNRLDHACCDVLVGGVGRHRCTRNAVMMQTIDAVINMSTILNQSIVACKEKSQSVLLPLIRNDTESTHMWSVCVCASTATTEV
jgi:hypothetical protein